MSTRSRSHPWWANCDLLGHTGAMKEVAEDYFPPRLERERRHWSGFNNPLVKAHDDACWVPLIDSVRHLVSFNILGFCSLCKPIGYRNHPFIDLTKIPRENRTREMVYTVVLMGAAQRMLWLFPLDPVQDDIIATTLPETRRKLAAIGTLLSTSPRSHDITRPGQRTQRTQRVVDIDYKKRVVTFE